MGSAVMLGGNGGKKLLYSWQMTDDMFDYIVPIVGYDAETNTWETDGSVDLTALPNYNTYDMNGPYALLVPTDCEAYIHDWYNAYTLPETRGSVGIANHEIKIKSVATDASHFSDEYKRLPSGHEPTEYVLKIYIRTGGFVSFRPELNVPLSQFGNFDHYEIYITSGSQTVSANVGKLFGVFSGSFQSFASQPSGHVFNATNSWGSIVRMTAHHVYTRLATGGYAGDLQATQLIVNQHGYQPAKAVSINYMHGYATELPWAHPDAGNVVNVLANRDGPLPDIDCSIRIYGWDD